MATINTVRILVPGIQGPASAVFTGTSSTSLTAGLGDHVVTLDPPIVMQVAIGQRLRLADMGSPRIVMDGDVTAWNPVTGVFTLDVDVVPDGTGQTSDDWSISIVGAHRPNEADLISFDPTGDIAATNVQAAIVEVHSEVYRPGSTDVAIADGGTGASTAAAGFDNLKQAATIEYSGVVELATTIEAEDGLDTERAVTPAGTLAAINQTAAGYLTATQLTDLDALTARIAVLEDFAESVAYEGGLSAEMTAFLARAPELEARAILPYDRFMRRLVAAGIWAKLDMLKVFCAPDEETALLDLKDGTFDATLVDDGSPETLPEFRPYSGFRTNGISNYIELGYNPGTQGVQYTQNSACFGIWRADSRGSNAKSGNSAGAGVFIQPRRAPLSTNSAQMFVSINSTSDTFSTWRMLIASGLSAVDRASNSDINILRNGYNIHSNDAASTAVSSGLLRLGKSVGGVYADEEHVACFAGAHLTHAQHRTLYFAFYELFEGLVVQWDDYSIEPPNPDATEPIEGLRGIPPNPLGARPFATTGSNYPQISAFYVPSTDTTWFAWEARTPDETSYQGALRQGRIINFNHTTGVWATESVCIEDTIADAHGNPIIQRDTAGYIYVAGSSHRSDQRWTKSDDPDGLVFTEQTPITGFFTYPQWRPTADGEMYLFMREGDTDDYPQEYATVYRMSDLNKVRLVDLGASRMYMSGTFALPSGEIMIPFTRTDTNDNFREDIFMLIWDTATGGVTNLTRTFSNVAGDLPLNLTELKANYMIYESPPGLCTSNPGIRYVAEDDFHMVYPVWDIDDGPSGAAKQQDIYYTHWDGTEFIEPEIISTQFSNLAAAGMSLRDDGGIDFYLAEARFPDLHGGYGDIVVRTRTEEGAWGPRRTIYNGTGVPLNFPRTIANPHPNARMTFSEFQRNDGFIWGLLKLYCLGDNGFLYPDIF